MKSLLLTIYKKPFFRYLFVGGSSFVLDLGILTLLYKMLGLNITIATSVAFWLAVIYNFILTRSWTFSVREKEQLKKHAVLYVCLLTANYLITTIFMLLTNNILYYALAKTIIVIVQTFWNYPIYKYLIFKKQ